MVNKIIIEKYGRRMIEGNNPNWRPEMSEPTEEEMLKFLDWMKNMIKSEWGTKIDDPNYEAIRRRILLPEDILNRILKIIMPIGDKFVSNADIVRIIRTIAMEEGIKLEAP